MIDVLFFYFINMEFINMEQKKFKGILSVKHQNNQQLSKPPIQTFCSGFQQRYWLKSHGRQQCISFTDEALMQLRKYFDSLDQKQNGSIGVQQLEDPFIAFGLSQNRQEVAQLIKSVDLDGSGTIQFDQFLAIMLKIKRGKSNKGQNNSAMFDFFQKLSKGSLGQEYDKTMSFKLNVSQFRRKKILESIMEQNKDKKQKGIKIASNFKKQILNNNQLKDILNESKKSNIYMYGFQTVKDGKKRF